MPWGLDKNSIEGIVTQKGYDLRTTKRRCEMIYRTAEMQKERDRITDLLKAGRTKEIPTYMDDLKN